MEKKKLNPKKIFKKSDGTTELKLEVILSLDSIMNSAIQIGNFTGNVGKINLSTDSVIGRVQLVLGFKNSSPQTLLKENIKNITADTYPVVVTAYRIKDLEEKKDYKTSYFNNRYDKKQIKAEIEDAFNINLELY